MRSSSKKCNPNSVEAGDEAVSKSEQPLGRKVANGKGKTKG